MYAPNLIIILRNATTKMLSKLLYVKIISGERHNTIIKELIPWFTLVPCTHVTLMSNNEDTYHMSFYLTVRAKNDNFFQCFSCLIKNNQFLNRKIKIISDQGMVGRWELKIAWLYSFIYFLEMSLNLKIQSKVLFLKFYSQKWHSFKIFKILLFREENYDSSLWRSVKDMWFVKSGIPFQEKKMKHTRRSADFDSVYSWRQNHATYSQPFTGKPYRRLY